MDTTLHAGIHVFGRRGCIVVAAAATGSVATAGIAAAVVAVASSVHVITRTVVAVVVFWFGV